MLLTSAFQPTAVLKVQNNKVISTKQTSWKIEVQMERLNYIMEKKQQINKIHETYQDAKEKIENSTVKT